MTLIHWLNQFPPFIEEVTEQICRQLAGRAITQDTGEDGVITGEVCGFRLVWPLNLEFADCVGLTCAIPFSAFGVATGTARSADGQEVTFTREGPVFGTVDIAFPDSEWSLEAYLRIYPDITRVVHVESVEFDD